MKTIVIKSALNELVKHIHRLNGRQPIEMVMKEAMSFVEEAERVNDPLKELEEELQGPIYLEPPEEEEVCHDCGKSSPRSQMFRFFPYDPGQAVEHFFIGRCCWKKPRNIERHREKKEMERRDKEEFYRD